MDPALRDLTRGAARSTADRAAYVRALERIGATETELLLPRLEAEDAGYLRAVRALPRPTPQQIADYAHFAACCHSHYKHLGFRPKTAFRFFLSPVPDAYDGAPHYASHPVAHHVKLYGHFEFLIGEPRTPPLRVRTDDDVAHEVPRPLLEAGTGWANCMVHPRFLPHCPPSAHEHHGIDGYEREVVNPRGPLGLHALWRRLRREDDLGRWQAHARQQRAEALVSFAEAMHTVCDAIYGSAERRERPPGRAPWFGEAPELPRPGQAE